LCAGLDEAWVLQYLSRLCCKDEASDGVNSGSAQGGLGGTCTGKEYIPNVFKDKRRRQVDAYFRTNGLIELSVLSRFQVRICCECVGNGSVRDQNNAMVILLSESYQYL
jgi:hypothetical protein